MLRKEVTDRFEPCKCQVLCFLSWLKRVKWIINAEKLQDNLICWSREFQSKGAL